MPALTPDKIYLAGFMGSGKSSVGPELARRLGWEFVDTDAWVETRVGRSVSQIFGGEGEASFRAMESDAIEMLSRREKLVVALGGGALGSESNRQCVAGSGALVYLKATVATLAKRLQGTDRPLLKGLFGPSLERKIESLLAAREAHYARASLTLDVEGKSQGEIASLIVEKLGLCAK